MACIAPTSLAQATGNWLADRRPARHCQHGGVANSPMQEREGPCAPFDVPGSDFATGPASSDVAYWRSRTPRAMIEAANRGRMRVSLSVVNWHLWLTPPGRPPGTSVNRRHTCCEGGGKPERGRALLTPAGGLLVAFMDRNRHHMSPTMSAHLETVTGCAEPSGRWDPIVRSIRWMPCACFVLHTPTRERSLAQSESHSGARTLRRARVPFLLRRLYSSRCCLLNRRSGASNVRDIHSGQPLPLTPCPEC